MPDPVSMLRVPGATASRRCGTSFGIDLEVDELAGLVHVEEGRLVEQAVERCFLIRQQGEAG